MASTSSLPRACLRLSMSPTIRPHIAHEVRSHARQLCTKPQRATPAPAPLLDFLAPSLYTRARPAYRVPSHSRPAQTRPQARCFSAAAPRRKAILNPRKDDDGNDMEIEITPRAASRLAQISSTDHNPALCLRVTVESGGCHGFQYLMSLTDMSEISRDEDTVFESDYTNNSPMPTTATSGGSGDGSAGEAYRAKVVMDEPSLELLKGAKVDYTMELIGSQFKVVGIPGAASSCGCGTSFDIKA
ncbi:hypothetical protein B0A49_04877 [Cryomyces minteri]|uniref:Core domain-containing protein n=1 Tax=Cryomyces minteri TaxID=331657 RepID=A0A4U0XN45_9PEZI|nr:hypothetical protein B0A49_04877 [Cryomyces minteri]